MKSKLFFSYILIILTAPSIGAIPPPGETVIGLMSKVILDVTRKEVGKEWRVAKRGETLLSGDGVRTGEKSIAVIKFKDNSMLRVREKTEVVLTGTQQGNSFSKSTELQRGVIGFNIKKQRTGEEFRFSSPTSVASIRGTGGQFEAQDSLDKLIVVDGLVRFTNSKSSESADVAGGFTGISTPDGKLQVRPSTPEEKLAAQLGSRLGDQDIKLDIDLQDGKGKKKQLEIKFK